MLQAMNEPALYFFLSRGLNPNLKQGEVSLLSLCCHNGYIHIIKYLCEKTKIIKDTLNRDRSTPLHYACRYGYLEIVKYLIEEQHVNPKVINTDGNTPFHAAIEMGHLDIVKYFIETKISDKEEQTKNGVTPFLLAIGNNRIEIMKYLIEELHVNINATFEGLNALQLACFFNSYDACRYLVDILKFDITKKSEYGESLLLISTIANSLNIIKYLVEEMNYDIESEFKGYQNTETVTPLYYASSRNRFDIVKYFIERCPFIISTDNSLDGACLKGQINIVKYLLEKGWDVNRTYPLHIAIASGYTKIVELLLNYGARYDKPGNYDLTPLFLAVAAENGLQSIKLMIEHSADVETKTKNGMTLLHAAVDQSRFDIVQYLVETAGANIETRDNNGQTPLFYAVLLADKRTTTYLIQKGANVNASDNNQCRPIHLTSNIEVLKLLIENKADINAKDSSGQTALIIAAKFGNLPVAVLLVENGADIDAKDNSSKTALMYAKEGNRKSIINYLISAGAKDF